MLVLLSPLWSRISLARGSRMRRTPGWLRCLSSRRCCRRPVEVSLAGELQINKWENVSVYSRTGPNRAAADTQRNGRCWFFGEINISYEGSVRTSILLDFVRLRTSGSEGTSRFWGQYRSDLICEIRIRFGTFKEDYEEGRWIGLYWSWRLRHNLKYSNFQSHVLN